MDRIVIEGLSIDVVQTITEIELINPRSVERVDTGIRWNGGVMLKQNGDRLGNRNVKMAIEGSTLMTFEDLDLASQDEYSKDYAELTVLESQAIQGKVLATNMITAINEADTGIAIEDVNSLVMSIVTALA